MSELLRVSASQLAMAHGCPRQWAYRYLERVQGFETEALQVGSAVHADVEALIIGTAPKHSPESDIGKMARALVAYATNLSGRHEVETRERVELPEYGLEVDLRVDYLDEPVFVDWKTTGAPSPRASLPMATGGRKFWALQSLENDFQARIYAYLLLRSRWRGQARAWARWVFVSKKFRPGEEPKTWELTHEFERAENEAWFERHVLPVAELIRDMRAAWNRKEFDSARMAPHNPIKCEGSGLFCDSAHLCGFKPSPVINYKDLQLPALPEKGA